MVRTTSKTTHSDQMQPAHSRIPAYSRSQAMEWSLVLVSQGIETAVENSQDGGGWELLVPVQDYDKALGVLEQYRLENRGWPWQQRILRPGFLFDWASLAWVILSAMFFWLNTRVDLYPIGLMDSTAVVHGQWWRLFTAMWLHADLGHLATNSAIGCVLLGLAMGRYGSGTGLLASYLAGAGGNVAAWLLSLEQHRNLGASGMVMGSLGLLSVSSLAFWRQHPRGRKYLISAMLAGVMLFILLGVTPGTDVMAHLGGFISGLVVGWMLLSLPSLTRKPAWNLVSGIIFALLVIVPWWLAMTHAPNN